MRGSTLPAFHAEFLALLGALVKARCRFIVVGGQALAVAGKPRFTQDLDVLVEPTPLNAARLGRALTAFGFEDLGKAVGLQFQVKKRMATIGVPPLAVDLMTSITGVDFAVAWKGRVRVKLGNLTVPFLGTHQLIANKIASGRDKDLIDVANLRELLAQGGGPAKSIRARQRAPRRR